MRVPERRVARRAYPRERALVARVEGTAQLCAVHVHIEAEGLREEDAEPHRGGGRLVEVLQAHVLGRRGEHGEVVVGARRHGPGADLLRLGREGASVHGWPARPRGAIAHLAPCFEAAEVAARVATGRLPREPAQSQRGARKVAGARDGARRVGNVAVCRRQHDPLVAGGEGRAEQAAVRVDEEHVGQPVALAAGRAVVHAVVRGAASLVEADARTRRGRGEPDDVREALREVGIDRGRIVAEGVRRLRAIDLLPVAKGDGRPVRLGVARGDRAKAVLPRHDALLDRPVGRPADRQHAARLAELPHRIHHMHQHADPPDGWAEHRVARRAHGRCDVNPKLADCAAGGRRGASRRGGRSKHRDVVVVCAVQHVAEGALEVERDADMVVRDGNLAQPRVGVLVDRDDARVRVLPRQCASQLRAHVALAGVLAALEDEEAGQAAHRLVGHPHRDRAVVALDAGREHRSENETRVGRASGNVALKAQRAHLEQECGERFDPRNRRSRVAQCLQRHVADDLNRIVRRASADP
mmetsp:Transcript_19876/g.50574  ORF Transcript_19876/g.50574 Transcript_19876/m.50574 type:complete len:527 (-) Transcript_19876:6605-8185(-)